MIYAPLRIIVWINSFTFSLQHDAIWAGSLIVLGTSNEKRKRTDVLFFLLL
jgi:hypothetical protein